MNFFQDVPDVAEAKKLYIMLAKTYHPDHAGTSEDEHGNAKLDTSIESDVHKTFIAMAEEYHQVLKAFDGCTVLGTDNKEHTYRYNRHVEQELVDKINLLIKLPGIEVELIGVWIWVGGETLQVKNQLKSLKLIWHSKWEKWYWRKHGYIKRKGTATSFDSIRDTYGSQTYANQSEEIKRIGQPK